MALDDVVSSRELDRIEVAVHRTVHWIDRNIGAHSRSGEQSLFGIIQGGLDSVRSAARPLPGRAHRALGLAAGLRDWRFGRRRRQAPVLARGVSVHSPAART